MFAAQGPDEEARSHAVVRRQSGATTHAVAVLSLLVLALLGVLARWGPTGRADARAVEALRFGHETKPFHAALALAELGSPLVLAAATLVGCVALLLVRRKSPAASDWRSVAIFGGAVPLAWAAQLVLKVAVRRQPPVGLDGAFQFSYPSGHTAGVFALATALLLVVGRRSGVRGVIPVASAYVVAAMVGASRVLTGAHFPTDVLAGAIVGVGSALALESALRVIDRRRRSSHRFSSRAGP